MSRMFIRALCAQTLVGLIFVAAVPLRLHGEDGEHMNAPRSRQLDNAQRLESQLDRSVTLEFDKTPLADVARFIADRHGIDVRIDGRELKAVGLRKDAPVTFTVRDVSLRSALRLMLREFDLISVNRDGVLTIETDDEVSCDPVIKVYRIDHLREPDSTQFVESQPQFDYGCDDIIDLITSTVRPTTWEEVGGVGRIEPLRNCLVVSQTPDAQREVAAALKLLAAAQDVAAASPSQPPRIASLPKRGANETRILKALAGEVVCDFQKATLQNVADVFADEAKINILVDRRALDGAGIGADAGVTLKVKGISMRSALRLILDPLGLTFAVRDEVLMITTPEEAESELETRFFPVDDLVTPWDDRGWLTTSSLGQGADYDSLIDLITSIVNPTDWEEVGGPGAVQPWRGCLVISQKQETLAEIQRLLTGLRKLQAEIRAHPGEVIAAPLKLDEFGIPSVAKLRKTLAGDVGMLAFSNTPLRDAVRQIADKHGAPIFIDRQALQDAGLDDTAPVSGTLGGEPLGDALRRLLRPLDLDWQIRHETITITTSDETDCGLVTRIYPVADLISPESIETSDDPIGASDDPIDPSDDPFDLSDEPLDADNDPLAPECSGPVEAAARTVLPATLIGGGVGCCGIDPLVSLITSIRPTTWEDVGGAGSVEPYPPLHCLVVSQTEEVHERIADTLARVRKIEAAVREEKRDADAHAAGPRAKDADVVRNKAGQRLHLKVYRLMSSDRETADELAGVIRDLVEPQSWAADDNYYLRALRGAIIVRHTSAAQRKIRSLLDVLDTPQLSPTDGGGLNGLGGGIGGGGGGLGGGVFAVPDHIQGQFLDCGLGAPPCAPVTLVPALSLPAVDDRPALPLCVYDQRGADGDELVATITDLIAPDDWRREGCYARSAAGKLIIRQRSDVHRKVEQLLLAIGAINDRSETPFVCW